MNPYYTPTPISEKPERAGYYHGSYDGTPTYDYFNGEKWRGDMEYWLKPVTGVLMENNEDVYHLTKEQLKEIWDAGREHEYRNQYGVIRNATPDFIEYIKRFKQ